MRRKSAHRKIVSEAYDIAASLVDDRLAMTSDPVVNQRTGITFRAEIQGISDLELATELGIDPRASDWFHVRDATVSINAGDRLSARGAIFTVLPKTAPDSADSPFRRYLVMQLAPKDA